MAVLRLKNRSGGQHGGDFGAFGDSDSPDSGPTRINFTNESLFLLPIHANLENESDESQEIRVNESGDSAFLTI